VIWRAKYEPFGKATVDEDPDGNAATIALNVRFPGQYEDAETGWHFNMARYYDPATGRYLTADALRQIALLAPTLNVPPVWGPPSTSTELLAIVLRRGTSQPSLLPGEEGRLSRSANQIPFSTSSGIDLYGYAGNDPSNAIDPFGLYEKHAICQRACDEVVPRQCPVDPRSEDGQAWVENQGPRCVALCIATYSELAAAGAPSSEISSGVTLVDALAAWIRERNQR
jgi:RHS repeat-associated protein